MGCSSRDDFAVGDSLLGRCPEAPAALPPSQAKQPDPKLLFNLARVLPKSGQLAEAVTYYQKYLDAGAEGSTEQRLKAQQRMEEARRAQALGTGVSPASQESPRGTPVYRKWWLWTVVGVAVAGYSDAHPFGTGVAKTGTTR